jgi:hypothetical protein
MTAAVITGDEDRTMQKTETNPTCPNCGASAGIPILYGYPSPGMIEDDDAGKIELGGCICTFEDPEWSCRACRHRWRYPCVVTSS